MISMDEGFEALEKWNRYFGFCRVYKCCGCWAVSNKTDEGIGGGDPALVAEGATPKEAILSAAEFLRDPKIPSAIPCPRCGTLMALHEYRYNCHSERMRLEFTCQSCWDTYMGDDICPDCFGNLEMPEDPEPDPFNPRPTWNSTCEKCGKIFLRGNIDRESEMVFPKWKFEPIDLAAIEKMLHDDEENR